jgi:hypothetical protein
LFWLLMLFVHFINFLAMIPMPKKIQIIVDENKSTTNETCNNIICPWKSFIWCFS